MMKEKKKTNRVLTIVLILGTVTVFFPLYMAAIIAFKKPSEMTNDVADREYHSPVSRPGTCPINFCCFFECFRNIF